MLMLSRKTNESIVIGDNIRVTITHIGRGRVQVAVEAPREVRVRREEIPAMPCAASLGAEPALVKNPWEVPAGLILG